VENHGGPNSLPIHVLCIRNSRDAPKNTHSNADPDGLRASTRAHLEQLLANVGEREDLEDIRRLIEADSTRFEKAQVARMKGDRSQDTTGYGLLDLEGVTKVDPAEAAPLYSKHLITTARKYW
jgi:hypothetical protein